jgi:hypothetical protein
MKPQFIPLILVKYIRLMGHGHVNFLHTPVTYREMGPIREILEDKDVQLNTSGIHTRAYRHYGRGHQNGSGDPANLNPAGPPDFDLVLSDPVSALGRCSR